MAQLLDEALDGAGPWLLEKLMLDVDGADTPWPPQVVVPLSPAPGPSDESTIAEMSEELTLPVAFAIMEAGRVDLARLVFTTPSNDGSHMAVAPAFGNDTDHLLFSGTALWQWLRGRLLESCAETSALFVELIERDTSELVFAAVSDYLKLADDWPEPLWSVIERSHEIVGAWERYNWSRVGNAIKERVEPDEWGAWEKLMTAALDAARGQ